MATETIQEAIKPALFREMGNALITAQSMEDAIRTILRPLEDIAEAFPILCAVEACLEKMAREVDPALDGFLEEHG